MYQRNRLEKAVQEVSNSSVQYLEDEFKTILEANVPYQEKCDSIGYAILSIDNKLQMVEKELDYLKEYKHKLKEAKSLASIAGAKVFGDYGITKIEGVSISSITTTSAMQSVKLDLYNANEQALIDQGFYKKVLDKAKVLKAYKEGEYKDFINANARVVEVEHYSPSKLRINRRRNTISNQIGDAA